MSKKFDLIDNLKGGFKAVVYCIPGSIVSSMFAMTGFVGGLIGIILGLTLTGYIFNKYWGK